MDEIRLKCPYCERFFFVPQGDDGKTVQCPDCNGPIRLPEKGAAHPSCYLSVHCPTCLAEQMIPISSEEGHYHICSDCGKSFLSAPQISFLCAEKLPVTTLGEHRISCPYCDQHYSLNFIPADKILVCEDCHRIFAYPDYEPEIQQEPGEAVAPSPKESRPLAPAVEKATVPHQINHRVFFPEVSAETAVEPGIDINPATESFSEETKAGEIQPSFPEEPVFIQEQQEHFASSCGDAAEEYGVRPVAESVQAPRIDPAVSNYHQPVEIRQQTTGVSEEQPKKETRPVIAAIAATCKIPVETVATIFRILGNILWLVLGGLLGSIIFLFYGVLLCLTIIGIPFGLQMFTLAALNLCPFGADVYRKSKDGRVGCLSTGFNILWLLLGGIWVALAYFLVGLLMCITVIGIPFGLQYFKLGKLVFSPFGLEIRYAPGMKVVYLIAGILSLIYLIIVFS